MKMPNIIEIASDPTVGADSHAGEPMREIARPYNVSNSTISRLAPGPFDAFGAKG